MGLELVIARAVAANVVGVTFNAAPLQGGSLVPGSIYDIRTLTISSPNRAHYTVLAVDKISDTVWLFTIFERMEDWRTTHTVSFVGLLDASSKPMDPGFTSITFPGLQDAATLAPPEQVRTPTDIHNASIFTSPGAKVPGTLAIGPGGDYEEDSGISLIKKLVIRRLLTPKGGFFHLPDYGLGLAVKEPINPTRIMELKTDIERQCKLEPEIGAVSAGISVGSNGVTVITIAGTTRSGQPFGPWEIAA
jgi:hypothetical protein